MRTGLATGAGRPYRPTPQGRWTCLVFHQSTGQRLWAGSSVVEHVTFNHVVVGSTPTRLTNEIKHLPEEAHTAKTPPATTGLPRPPESGFGNLLKLLVATALDRMIMW
jgi:hypothetical protein